MNGAIQASTTFQTALKFGASTPFRWTPKCQRYCWQQNCWVLSDSFVAFRGRSIQMLGTAKMTGTGFRASQCQLEMSSAEFRKMLGQRL